MLGTVTYHDDAGSRAGRGDGERVPEDRAVRLVESRSPTIRVITKVALQARARRAALRRQPLHHSRTP
jgi:hypothetical protein